MSVRRPRQEVRLFASAVYIALCLVAGVYANASIPPPFGDLGLWFYGGFIPLIVASLVIEFPFARPADALANGLGVLVAVAAFDPRTSQIPAEVVAWGRATLAIYAAGSLVGAMVAMLGRDSDSPLARVGPAAARFSASIGRALVGFSLFLGFVSIAMFGNRLDVIGVFLVVWIAVVRVHPAEWLMSRIVAWWNLPDSRHPSVVVDAVMDPALVHGHTGRASDIKIGDLVQWPNGAAGVVVEVTQIESPPSAVVSLATAAPISVGSVGRVVPGDDSGIVGWVTAGSALDHLAVRVSSAASAGVEEGRLLRASVRGRPGFFQVTSAKIVEHVQVDGHRRSWTEVGARELGVWNDEKQRFEQMAWLADTGMPVSVVAAEPTPETVEGVGHVPGTKFQIRPEIGDIVTHNTAILGVLGAGKTTLAFELIQRMLTAGILVVVLDITGQYVEQFAKWCPADEMDGLYASLEEAIKDNRGNTRLPKQAAGNINDVKPAFLAILERFAAGTGRLLVVNPATPDVTAEDGSWDGRAQLRTLTPSEVTRLLVEALLDFAKAKWPSDPRVKVEPHLCVVLEEAHSLVPEIGTADRNEATIAVRTSRAVLQGRKFGFGALVISQRTANVAKTLLNQCQTVFAMRSVDATSEEFLANYFGKEYASLLPTLEDQQAVFFGRGSTTSAPVLLQLNKREVFDESWAESMAAVDVTRLAPQEQGSQAAHEEAQDGEADAMDTESLPF